MTIISRVLAERWIGEWPVWFPSRSSKLDNINGFSYQLRKFNIKNMEKVINSSKCKKFSVGFFYFKGGANSLKAFALPEVSENGRFLVGLSKELVERLHALVYESRLVNKLRPQLTVMSSSKEEDIANLIAYFIFIFISYHEIAHLVEGHTGYLKFLSKNPSLNGSTEAARFANSQKNSYLFECEADMTGARAVSLEISPTANKYAKQLKISSSLILGDMTQIAFAAITLFFLVLDDVYKGSGISYPEPSIRLALTMSVLNDNIFRNENREEIGLKAHNGIKYSLNMLRDLGLRSANYDLAKSMKMFLNLAPELERIRLKAREHRPCKKKTDRKLELLINQLHNRLIQSVLNGFF